MEDEKPRPNVYIPPNLRKKTQEEAVILDPVESAPIKEESSPVLDQNVPDRAADGSEIIETTVVEAPNDVRTDPDGQSSEPDIVKDQSVNEEDTNDSGFIECGKNSSDKCNYFFNLNLMYLYIKKKYNVNRFLDKSKKKPKVIKKLSEIEVKKK